MIKQEFLVATHLAWEPTSQLTNCLVTWEVFGGGLMGNLLTDSANIELSLWPETKYIVQVTCKNKVSIWIHLIRFVLFFPSSSFGCWNRSFATVSSRSFLPRYLIYCCMLACMQALHIDPSRSSWSFRQFKCIIRYAANPSLPLFARTFQLKS